jgi:hypothetical protein
MPKDDYFRIQYRILEYLCECMRSGTDVAPEAFGADAMAPWPQENRIGTLPKRRLYGLLTSCFDTKGKGGERSA